MVIADINKPLNQSKTVAICVDLDETLVSTIDISRLVNLPENERCLLDDFKQVREYLTKLRPGAIEFIKELYKITPNVYIMTNGERDLQSEIISIHEIPIKPDHMICRFEFDSIPYYDIIIIIDNMIGYEEEVIRKFGTDITGFSDKIKSLNSKSQIVEKIPITEYDGINDKNVFPSILGHIRKIIGKFYSR